MEYEKTVPMSWIYTHYSEIVSDVTGKLQKWIRRELGSLKVTVKDFTWNIVETVEMNCDFGLYNLRYH